MDPASPPGSGQAGDGHWDLPGLGVGATASVTLSHAFATAGTYWLYAQVDTLDVVTERLESNNIDGESLAVVDQTEDVCGSITADATWHAGTLYHVTCDVTVQSGVTLTVEPGVTVQFSSSTGLGVYGTLVVSGTASSPVRLSSRASSPAQFVFWRDGRSASGC